MPSRVTLAVLVLFLAGCGNRTVPLPTVKDDDPVAQLNPGRWQATVNDLTAPPGDGAPRRLPAPVPASREAAP
jgi:hypothetical protein